MKMLVDILLFRRLVAPVILQVLFWAGFVGNCYGSWWLFSHDHWAWWIALIGGLLLTRLLFEMSMVMFRSHEQLAALNRTLSGKVDET